jgi:hypothetical protein
MTNENRFSLFGCGPGLLTLCVLTGVVFFGVIPQALWLPMGLFYDFLRQGIRLPPGTTDTISFHIWILVAPLAFLNLGWMVYGLCCWRSKARRQTDSLEPESDDPYDYAKRWRHQ